MRYGIAAAIFALAMIGSGVMAAGEGVGPPSDPPTDTPPRIDPPADLSFVSDGHASDRAVARTAEVSPVFGGASPTGL